jgi:capsid protein
MDFVADFRFHPTTPNKSFNVEFTQFVKRWSNRKRCHTAERHSLARLVRISEFCRTVDGDVLWELVKGGRINLIRADRIRSPYSTDYVNGVKLGPNDESVAFSIHRRGRWGVYQFQKILRADNAIHHAYWTDSDQIRGVSPLTTALNPWRDTYEGLDFLLLKLKVEALLGVAITKKDDGSAANPFQGNHQFADPDSDEDESEEAAEAEARKGTVDFGPGPWQMELRPGEDIKSIQGSSPSANAQLFLESAIQIALKSIDLPYSFFREDFTNFYGSRGALQLYKRSANAKQAGNQETLKEATAFSARWGVLTGELTLPRGWTVDDLEFAWVPRGIPWWDRATEIEGDIRAVGAGLDSIQNVLLERSEEGDAFSYIDQTAELLQYAEERGVVLNFQPVPQVVQVKDEKSESPKKKKSKGED